MKLKMDGLNKIVVGVEMPNSEPWDAANLKPATRIAVRQAFHLAASMAIPLQLVAVLTRAEAAFFGSEDDAERRAAADEVEAHEVLSGLQADYAELSADSTVEVVFGRAWLEILRAADASRRTLIICGIRTGGAVTRLLFGSTGIKLLRNAPGPVWLVKPRIDDDATWDVLAATDLSEVGSNVIAAGITLGRALPVQLTVMHAVEFEFERRMAHIGVSDEEIATWRAEAKADAEERLQAQLAETDYRTLANGVETQIVEGVADACVLSAIENMDIDLLIMASSGRGGIPGMLFGNTAERLLPELPCSLLTIKPDDFVCPIDLN